MKSIKIDIDSIKIVDNDNLKCFEDVLKDNEEVIITKQSKPFVKIEPIIQFENLSTKEKMLLAIDNIFSENQDIFMEIKNYDRDN